MTKCATRALLCVLLFSVFCLAAEAGVVDPELQARLDSATPDQPLPVIVVLSTRADLNAVKDKVKSTRRRKIIEALRQHATLKQKALLSFLKDSGATRIRPLWINNSVAAIVPAGIVRDLANVPGVARVQTDATVNGPGPSAGTSAAPEWNITKIHAPEVWGQGYTGQGVVVASMDTGVDASHPDLATRWRGGTNSWYDPHNQHATPFDASGHGTQTMGLMVGGDAGGTAIGVAPGARWIAVKIFNDKGRALASDIHLGFQWLLDPDGNSLTNDAPDVVNNSWAYLAPNTCNLEFQADIQALKAAAIAVVFSAGNEGPGASTSESPANNPPGFAAGAVDSTNLIGSFSSRGPSACDGTIFPEVVAPGVNVSTADLSYGGGFYYTTGSGTSYAAPHLSGAMALLLNASPSAAVSALESALTDSALDLGPVGTDNTYGHGLINVAEALTRLSGGGQNPVVIDDIYSVAEDTALSIAAPGVLGNDSDPQNDPLTASAMSGVVHGALAFNPDGSFTYTPNPNFNGADSFTYRASDGVHESGMATVTITVNPVNDPPVANADAYTMAEGTTLNVPAPGVLGNDTDIDGDVLTATLVSGPAHGTLTLNPNGSLSYTPALNDNGPDSFSYQACDPSSVCSTATASITVTPVNKPPVATNDGPYSVVSGQTLTIVAPGVLGNDTDPDSPTLTAQLVTPPTQGSLALNADGSFTFNAAGVAPGSYTFTYRASDGAAVSNVATVTIAVQVAPNDQIFSDSFESGNFSAWSAKVGSNLTVAPEAAIVGTKGMKAVISSTTSMYVTDNTPANEARYRARFYFSPNSITMASGDTHRIMVARNAAGADVLRIEFRYSTGAYQVSAYVRSDAGAYLSTSWFTIANAPHPVEIDWRAATASGANNGYLSLWIDGVLKQTRASVDNDTLRVEDARLGPLQGIDARTRGTEFFDDFVSRRTTYIGP